MSALQRNPHYVSMLDRMPRLFDVRAGKSLLSFGTYFLIIA